MGKVDGVEQALLPDGPPEPRPRPRPGPGGGGTGGGGTEQPGYSLGRLIKKKWNELGGMSWARPDDESGEVSSGPGRWAQFIGNDQSLRVIAWSAVTGTHEVSPPLLSCWSRTGTGRGALGFPTTDGLVTHDRVGRFQAFANGTIVWHPKTGAFETHGAINAVYAAVKGSYFGYPTTDETATPDGRGRFNHFMDVATGQAKSIYWTAQTGAHAIQGEFRAKYAAQGWERGLGYPTNDETTTSDNTGRYQNFENGTIVWHPQTGTFATRGNINARYAALNGSHFGYPTTDETATPDGLGRYNHFLDPRSGARKSIYWTPQTGSHEVYGPIRDRWEQLGWERSLLGYPTAGPQPWPDGGAGALQQTFQGGRILVRDDGVTIEDPLVFGGGLRGGQGFGGNANIYLFSDGRVRFFGEVTNGAYQDYDYSIYALVKTPTVAIAKYRTGEINAQVFGRNVNRWSEDDTHGFVGYAFADLAGSTFELYSDHQGGITGALNDILGTLGAWAVTRALGPALVGVIYLGIEIGAAASGGSWEAGPRIVAGSMWMLGPEGYLLAMPIDALARLGTRSRGLLPDEKKFLRIIFGDTIDLNAITLTDTSGKSNRAFTFPSPMPDTSMNINLADSYEPTSMLATKAGAALLAHETTHVWQYKYLANHSSYVVLGIFDTEYEPGTIGKPWYKYNIEQQATIVEEWVEQWFNSSQAANDYGLASPDALNDNRFRYVSDNIRTGRRR